MSEPKLPILYSFRRCPYAMRARMALVLTNSQVVIREVVLKNKPATMLQASPKATVPVLVLAKGQIIEESLEIIDWAIAHDNSVLKQPTSAEQALINTNDGAFKSALDQYKYFDRFPQQDQAHYRSNGEQFLQTLEQLLANNHGASAASYQTFLFGNVVSYADIAIFPFIRQFNHVDKAWFDQAPYPHIKRWLEYFLTSEPFLTVMQKLPAWSPEEPVTYFPATLEH